MGHCSSYHPPPLLSRLWGEEAQIVIEHLIDGLYFAEHRC